MGLDNWSLDGKNLIYCNCDFGCPCEANADPTRGECTGIVGFYIDEGHFGDVRLDGLSFAATYHFPAALHHGKGTMQPIIDESATDEQREALFAILSSEGQPDGTMFSIFAAIVETFLEPLFLPITFEFDIENRTGRLAVPGISEAESKPIRNPVTDEVHRMKIVLPDGWQYKEAEVVNGSARGTGEIKFDYSGRHSSLSYFRHTPQGLVA